MLENINYSLFALLNATPTSGAGMINLAIFFAKYLILIVPLLLVVCWLWGAREEITAQRQLVLKASLALVISLVLSGIIGLLFPHARPFAAGVGYSYLPHAPDTSFPSDHGTIIFTFALAFLVWHRLWSGLALLVVAIAIAWSRIYLGVHWPLDMLGGLLVGMCGCLLAQLAWPLCGPSLLPPLQQLYRRCFFMLIRKGWVRD